MHLQVASRFTGIAHVFHYTVEQLYDLDYDMWVILATDFDQYVRETKEARSRSRRRR